MERDQECIEREYQIIRLEEKVDLNTERIAKLEKNQEAVTELAKSVAVIATQQQYLRDEITETKNGMHETSTKVDEVNRKLDALNPAELANDVRELQMLPAKRWNTVVEKIILTAVAGVVGFLLAQIGLG